MTRTRPFTAIVFAVALGIGLWAQAPAPQPLPLENLGLEHLDIVVPDTAASARFYARIFKTKLHEQPVRDTLRYFVLLGDLPQDRQVGYIAIGAGQGRPASIGHYCVLAKTYNRDAFANALEAAGLPSKATAPGPIGMWPDPDGLELQLFQPPAGLVTAAVDSALPVGGDGIVSPLGLDHVMLNVSSLDKALPYYRGVYGTAVERPRDANGRVWLSLAHNTRIGLQPVRAGESPAIDHFAIKVAPYDRGALTARLRELGASVLPSTDEPGVLRFRDNNGITVELQTVEPPKLTLKVHTGRGQVGYDVNSTMISGERDMLVIDPQFSLSEAHKLAAEILESKKHLAVVYSTHPHPDHLFGLAVLKQAFPDARFVALPATVNAAKTGWPARQKFWFPTYGSNIPGPDPVLPEELASPMLTLEGQQFPITGGVQGADGPGNSFVWIPSLKAVVTGDIVFDHTYFGVPRDMARENWRKTIDQLAALKPEIVIPGHEGRGATHDWKAIDWMNKYIAEWDANVRRSKNAAEMRANVLRQYPNLGMDFTLNDRVATYFPAPPATGGSR
jgi:glyoxylase-like metal-dependent hydrolase (beta-lactamase superfamily II)/catechol 2,3-dioxygenase-like lactoylglutathione lyase family enzyme